jgi:uncharacterized repeat protein (TIGR04138 family)
MSEARKKVMELAGQGRYRLEAYQFLLNALNYTVKSREKQGLKGHVTGGELLGGIREFGLREYGFLARTVFEQWGVRETDDFGEIVFELVEAEVLSKQDTDRKQDFAKLYDFGDAFEGPFRQN